MVLSRSVTSFSVRAGISCSFRNGVSTLKIGFSSHQPRLTEKEKMPLRISLALCLWREVVKVFIRMLWQSSTLMFRRGVCSSSGLLFLSFWMMLLMSVSVRGLRWLLERRHSTAAVPKLTVWCLFLMAFSPRETTSRHLLIVQISSPRASLISSTSLAA